MPNAIRLPAKLDFVPLQTSAGYDRALRRAMHERSGVYVVRRRGKKRPEYVGESHTGRAWKTLLRHFQGIASFRARDEWAPCVCADRYEVAFLPTRADKALSVEARAIRRYRPAHNLSREARSLAAEVGF